MIEILTALLVVITGVYAFVTHRILKANESAVAAVRDQSEALTRPYLEVSPYLPPKTSILYLRIRNVGRTAAFNLQLDLDRDFFRFGRVQADHNLASYNAFNLPISTFPPGGELLFYLAQGFVIFGQRSDEKITPTVFTITAKYSYGARTFTEKTEVDLRPYLETTAAPNALIDKLDELKKTLERFLQRVGEQ